MKVIEFIKEWDSIIFLCIVLIRFVYWLLCGYHSYEDDIKRLENVMDNMGITLRSIVTGLTFMESTLKDSKKELNELTTIANFTNEDVKALRNLRYVNNHIDSLNCDVIKLSAAVNTHADAIQKHIKKLKKEVKNNK